MQLHRDMTLCEICQKVFNRVYDLRRHLRNVHKIEKIPMRLHSGYASHVNGWKSQHQGKAERDQVDPKEAEKYRRFSTS
ncbi:hypothetical protein RUM43_008767 [Polyplax serrata]|uniref:C2H2-type domain-containing protein n=1 Tax=Polyplax serrata TaxID=468196 RepID=A0AAN8NNZ3_POLSC